MNNKWQLIPSHAIDVCKWNTCINQSHQPLIYANTYYLNALCTQWLGLIVQDYEAVMPIPIKKKWGITYCYQPTFIQQLGLFQKISCQHSVHEILKWISAQFRYGDLFVPLLDPIPHISNCAIEMRDNFTLNLNDNYTNIAARYSGDLKRNLLKAHQYQLVYHHKITPKVILTQFYQQYHQIIHLNKNSLNAFEQLLLEKQMQSHFFVRAVNNIEGEIVAAGIFLRDNYRIYNIINFTTPTGRKQSANHFLLDRCICEFAGTNLIFDFEGSTHKGIQKFYKNFQPTHQPYIHLHINRLPIPFKYLKQ
jgi:hypothetical protein